MNQWSRRRKRLIFLLVLFVVVVIIGLPTYLLLYQAPTCFDGKQNGTEEGVDCGGSCQLLCTADSLPLVLKGDPRVLRVAPGVYEVVALVENSNTNAEVYRAGYTVRIYDASSAVPLKVIDGSTFVPKGRNFAIFEGPFNLGVGEVPVRATLEWKGETLVWRRSTLDPAELSIKNISLTREAESPRLTATVANNSLEDVSNVDLVALVSDETGSIFAASKSFIEYLPTGEERQVVFTWPRPFESRVSATDIIIRILPDKSFIR